MKYCIAGGASTSCYTFKPSASPLSKRGMKGGHAEFISASELSFGILKQVQNDRQERFPTSWNDNTRVRMTSGNNRITNKVISMKTLIIKSLLTSLCQREVIYPSLEKRGKGRFFNNDALLMNSLVNAECGITIKRISNSKSTGS